jgi:hypothetical protein
MYFIRKFFTWVNTIKEIWRVNPAEVWHFWAKMEVSVSDFYEIWYTYWALWETEKSKILQYSIDLCIFLAIETVQILEMTVTLFFEDFHVIQKTLNRQYDTLSIINYILTKF